ncbi:hypothetical protein ANAPC5_00480 [Anaplasma phagocytophilum]|nr:hypothetical protein ANAPC2_00131 [Anaplasma phagocytophilum]SBO31174.1 hypothetical protein ANAPC3_00439 [Anaplasma phagocytophilum]SBO31525.1 hypothetical protein ANAPC4_00507 [Anaplasma phagocytophilum]SCV63166.1 hypothetical protein ANAPC5_00480 [Anaplasma phagocytophilum]
MSRASAYLSRMSEGAKYYKGVIEIRGGLNILSAFDLGLKSRTRHTIHVSNINCAARVC